MTSLAHPQQYIKAIWAGATAFIGTLIAALVTLQEQGADNPAPGDLGWIAWLTIVAATMAAFAGTFGFRNAPVDEGLDGEG